MDSGGSKSESQDSSEPAPPGTVKFNLKNIKIASPSLPSPTTTLKGVKNAKSKLRAFSIQKKGPITPVPVAKGPVAGSGTGNATVYIGKLAAVKVTPKQDYSTVERPPKPPKPGAQRHIINESYTEKQKKTLSEIEGMKRRMELVELGIPLGLICPVAFNDNFLPTKAMPTKAMPPIKTFLDPEKVDEIIREAKKAKAEGKEFKFDYHKLLPDYDNPFQRRKEEPESHRGDSDLSRNKDTQKDYKLDWKYETYKRSDKNKFKDERSKHDRKSERKDKPEKDCVKDKKSGRKLKEARVNLNDYLVCDSWSLDNDDKNSTSSPKIDERAIKNIPLPDDFPIVERETPRRTIEDTDSPLNIPPKLQSVNDSLTYEIDPNDDDDDEILDIFNEDCSLDKFTKTTIKKETYDSPVDEVIELDQSLSKDTSLDGTIDDTFLESVINEIKQEDMSDDEDEKGLVEYDMSPKDDKDETRGSITPELKDYHCSQRSNYSDGYRSTESGYKSTESGNRSTKSYQSDNEYKSSETSSKSTEREYKSKKRYKSSKNKSDYKSTDELNKSYTSEDIGYKSPETEYKPERDYKSSNRRYEDDYKSSDSGYKSKDSTYKSKDSVDSRRLSFLSSGKEFEEETTLSKATLDSLETWSFVLKICQPLLFRHDRNKCYKETEVLPKLWYTENPKICNCVEDRSVVYEELEMVKMSLVDRVYGCDQIPDPPCSKARSWYVQSSQCFTELTAMGPPPDPSMTPQRNEEIYLDREYQRFMQAVLSDVSETKQETSRSTTPVTLDIRKKKKSEDEEEKKKAKKIKLSSEGWSQESDIEEEPQKTKKMKLEKDRVRKRKHSVSSLSDSDIDVKRKRKAMKKKENKKLKSKVEKRRRLSKKYLKKLKEKEKKNKKIKLETFDEESEDDMKKEKRKSLQKKLQKQKKKNQKKRKSKPKSSSSSDSSSSSSDSSDSEDERRRRRKEKKKRKKSTSESTQSEELFDVNILNNIKKERLTDDEKNFSPRKKPREIINVKELQNDFVENNIDIKKEREDKQVVQDDAEKKKQESPELAESVCSTPVEKCDEFKVVSSYNITFIVLPHTKSLKINNPDTEKKKPTNITLDRTLKFFTEIKTTPQIQPAIEESNLSQCSSQDSVLSKDRPIYEKDESHLRPSSQNSNYSFNDVISASHQLEDVRSASRQLTDVTDSQMSDTLSGKHQMSESLSASRQTAETRPVSSPPGACSQRIETVVRARSRGEIKCDWRAGDDTVLHAPHRPSRWGLKPGEVNIVLTGHGSDQFANTTPEDNRVYQIQSIANRTDTSSNTGYDEAYMSMYGASDRLQYGDCFATVETQDERPSPNTSEAKLEQHSTSTLDARISHALKNTVLGEVAKLDEKEIDKDGPDKGILVTKSLAINDSVRGAKRVSFADGYKPGQDSDLEEPPKKKRKTRRFGCAWPCPATHADHVPLWDALPPPPPPPGSPPPAPAPPPLRAHLPHLVARHLMKAPHAMPLNFESSPSLPAFMPPEPPPGVITF
ncbi:hypothetical protein K1T71_013336 [Dendrolimus kikuchii]|uniref:Uncharacterized protein n=1 Tax=Dendrolimus kikuchii TaxID=765133 RepID=A0ACC1CHU2_9NEOP|nr:hypothetical protein K1T71_013336 [Dendrolimus kikuchii]